MIEFHNVTKRYEGGYEALSNVSLQLGEGQIQVQAPSAQAPQLGAACRISATGEVEAKHGKAGFRQHAGQLAEYPVELDVLVAVGIGEQHSGRSDCPSRRMVAAVQRPSRPGEEQWLRGVH